MLIQADNLSYPKIIGGEKEKNRVKKKKYGVIGC